MSLDPQDPEQQAVLYVEERINAVVDRVTSVLRPLWEVTETVAQSLIWISGGALALSITLTQIYASDGPTVVWGWLLPAAWVLLTLTIVFSLMRIGFLMRVRTAPLEFEKKKKKLRTYVRSVYEEPGAGEKVDQMLESMWENAWQEPKKVIGRHDIVAGVGALTFILGLAALMTFAVINVPYS